MVARRIARAAVDPIQILDQLLAEPPRRTAVHDFRVNLGAPRPQRLEEPFRRRARAGEAQRLPIPLPLVRTGRQPRPVEPLWTQN